MNSDFAAVEKKYKSDNNLPSHYQLPKNNLPADFPIEYARQRNLWWITLLFIFSTSLYGFSFSFEVLTSRPGWLTVPLSFQFLIAATSNAIFAVNSTYVTDLCPGRGASSTAINNLIRCSFGAFGVAFIEKMILSFAVGPTFLGLGILTAACFPLLVLARYYGMEWRLQKTEQKSLKETQDMT
jgi:MFS family permease